MMGLPLAFSAPLALTALALLPVLYYLLRLTPPRPREVPFPPLKLILDLDPKDETPARTPWWLLALRLAIAAAIIAAMAGPIWNPPAVSEGGKGPLVVLLDDGWSAAPSWKLRMAQAAERLAAAGRDGRASAVAAMSEGARELAAADTAKTLERLRTLKPAPFLPARAATLAALKIFITANPAAEIVWVSDGLENGGARAFAEALTQLGAGVSVSVARDGRDVLALAGAENQPGALSVALTRADADGAPQGKLRALDQKGLSLGETAFNFAGGRTAQAKFDLPVELRNEIASVEIADAGSAGAVTLLDDRWKRRRVGIVAGNSSDIAQPLLAPSYYLAKALAPFADIREIKGQSADPVVQLIDEKSSVLVLADVGVVSGAAHDRLARFIEEGGVLLRFSGTRLAGSSDDLVPVRLRRGGRTLGGSLSWDTPKKLAPFERESPFFGLRVPDEVTVTRQVLAEPEPGLAAKTWAQLADGTPLVTAARRGKGLIVLVHVSADTTWSNLPLSGLFVDMLQRIVALSGRSGAGDEKSGAEAAPGGAATLAPLRILDGYGVLGAPPVTAKPLPVNFSGAADMDHPPGFYGTQDARLALNAMAPGATLERADFSGLNISEQALQAAEPVDLRAWIIALAFIGFLADAFASLWLGGGFRRKGAAALAATLICACAITAAAPPARAAETAPAATQREREAALVTRLAYAVTGNKAVDEASRLGLLAVTRVLTQRTSLRPGEPAGVDPARDDLSFYPMIYWPVAAEQAQPGAEAVAKISAYMKQGGTIVFDTRDALSARPGGPPTPEARWLRDMLRGVDVPELEPVPRDHVLGKTFYLLDNFTGRTTIGQTWIEALPPVDPDDTAPRVARAGDSVSPIIITSNDLAAAWAVDKNNEPLFPLVPGGARQREMALRAGVNIVMYTLTGNYKADQVHVRELLERLAN